jgi:hypothetical protein
VLPLSNIGRISCTRRYIAPQYFTRHDGCPCGGDFANDSTRISGYFFLSICGEICYTGWGKGLKKTVSFVQHSHNALLHMEIFHMEIYVETLNSYQLDFLSTGILTQ